MSFNKAFIAPKVWGRWVESAVGAYLLNNAEEYDYKLYYWREREDEVDFIIDSDSKLIAIEVKSGRRTDNEGLSEFKKRFNPDYSLVVGSGGVPLEEFLTWDLGKLIDDWE
jgi:predicted AAA+ superfamily ATPase